MQLPNTNSSSNNNSITISGNSNSGSGNAGDLYFVSGISGGGFDGAVYIGDGTNAASSNTKIFKFTYNGATSSIQAPAAGTGPSYSFQGSTNSGMQYAGALELLANGHESFFINTDGTIQMVFGTSIGAGSLATNATTGFAYLNSYSAGKPTGTPQAVGGPAFDYDTTNNQLCIYNTVSSAWKCATFN
jgi:hypothetical protein